MGINAAGELQNQLEIYVKLNLLETDQLLHHTSFAHKLNPVI